MEEEEEIDLGQELPDADGSLSAPPRSPRTFNPRTAGRNPGRRGRGPASRAMSPRRYEESDDGRVRIPKCDPCPTWDGKDPEKTLRPWLREYELWLLEAKLILDPELIGKRVSRALIGKAADPIAHLTASDIASPYGHEQIIELIKEANVHVMEKKLEDAFDEAIYRGRREKGENMTPFVTRKRVAFMELRRLGMDFLSSDAGKHLMGHIILKQGYFTNDQKQRGRKTRIIAL